MYSIGFVIFFFIIHKAVREQYYAQLSAWLSLSDFSRIIFAYTKSLKSEKRRGGAWEGVYKNSSTQPLSHCGQPGQPVYTLIATTVQANRMLVGTIIVLELWYWYSMIEPTSDTLSANKEEGECPTLHSYFRLSCAYYIMLSFESSWLCMWENFL